MRIARSFNCGFDAIKIRKPRRGGRIFRNDFVCAPERLYFLVVLTRSFNCGLFSEAPSERRRLARNWMAK